MSFSFMAISQKSHTQRGTVLHPGFGYFTIASEQNSLPLEGNRECAVVPEVISRCDEVASYKLQCPRKSKCVIYYPPIAW